jgi:lysophospholipase L1-like esterase
MNDRRRWLLHLAALGASSAAWSSASTAVAATKTSSPQAANKLRVVATDNRVCRSAYSFTFASHGAQTAVASRNPFVIGSGDVAGLVVCLDRWYRLGAAEMAPKGNVVMQAVIENETGTIAVRVKLGGSDTIALAAGDSHKLCDPILPAAFGLATFVKGSKWYWKDVSVFDASAGEICENGFAASDDAGSLCFCYDPATFKLSSIETPGPFKTSGDRASYFALPSLYRPTILGTYANGDPLTMGAIIDSLVATGQGDPQGGYALRAARAVAGGPIAFLNFARDGGDLTQVEAGVKTRAMYSYAPVWIAEAGANDLIYSSLARFQATEAFTYTAMRAAGVQKIIRPAILPRTLSSDNWLTAANQTYQHVAWQPGGVVDQANAWFAAKLAGGTVDFVPVFPELLDATTPQKWKSDGRTPNLSTIDGTHPSVPGQALMAAKVVAYLDGLKRKPA